MTKTKFIELCNSYTIDPLIALENDNIIKALKQRNDKEVIRIIQEEF